MSNQLICFSFLEFESEPGNVITPCSVKSKPIVGEIEYLITVSFGDSFAVSFSLEEWLNQGGE